MGMSSYVLDEEEKQFNHRCQVHMNNGLTAGEAIAAALDEDYHACRTGDCDHKLQTECDLELATINSIKAEAK